MKKTSKSYMINLIAFLLSLNHANAHSLEKLRTYYIDDSNTFMKKAVLKKDSGTCRFSDTLSAAIKSGIRKENTPLTGGEKSKLALNLDMKCFIKTEWIDINNQYYSEIEYSLAAMPMYRINNFEFGIPFRFEAIAAKLVPFQSKTYITLKSFGLSVNYHYGKQARVTYQVIARFYKNYYQYASTKEKDGAFSGLLGWGIVYKSRCGYVSPIVHLNAVTKNKIINTASDLLITSGFLINYGIYLK